MIVSWRLDGNICTIQLEGIMKISRLYMLLVVLLSWMLDVAYADWELVLLSDESDFDPNCEYRAIADFKFNPVRVWFTQAQNKRIGYLHDSDKRKANAYVASNKKANLRLETKSGYLIHEWPILKLEKNCLSQTLKEQVQKTGGGANNKYGIRKKSGSYGESNDFPLWCESPSQPNCADVVF